MLSPLQPPAAPQREEEQVEVEGAGWAAPFVADFRARFLQLLAGAFRGMAPGLALAVLRPKLAFGAEEAEGFAASADAAEAVRKAGGAPLDPHDLQRLGAYAGNLVDSHLVLDLVPPLARAFFSARLPASLSHAQVSAARPAPVPQRPPTTTPAAAAAAADSRPTAQAAILLCLGLQHKTLADIQRDLDLPPNQSLALFHKAVRKLHALLKRKREAAAARGLPAPEPVALAPHAATVDEDLEEAAAEAEHRAQLQASALAADRLEGFEAPEAAEFAAQLGAAVPGAAGRSAVVAVPASGKATGGGEEATASAKKKKKARKGKRAAGDDAAGAAPRSAGKKPKRKQRQ